MRALTLNPKAAAVWGYLRTSLVCDSRMDLLQLVDEENVDALRGALEV